MAFKHKQPPQVSKRLEGVALSLLQFHHSLNDDIYGMRYGMRGVKAPLYRPLDLVSCVEMVNHEQRYMGTALLQEGLSGGLIGLF